MNGQRIWLSQPDFCSFVLSVMLHSISCPCKSVGTRRGNMSGVFVGVLNHVPLYLHVCSACFVWEVGHRMTIKKCEEVASNVLIPL